jgi:hypothetical protein
VSKHWGCGRGGVQTVAMGASHRRINKSPLHTNTPTTHVHTQAQSSIIPAFDAFLGVQHEMDTMREYLVEMRRYMPQPHVAFIERLERLEPPVREIVLGMAAAATAAGGGGDDGGKKEEEEEGSAAATAVAVATVEAYDTALEALARFRCVLSLLEAKE